MNEANFEPMRTLASWRSLIDTLNRDGRARLSNFNVDSSFFHGNGWNFDHGNGTTAYTAAVFSTPNGPRRFLTQLSLFDAIFQHGQGRPNHWFTSAELRFSQDARGGSRGVLVELNTDTGMLEVLFFNAGVWMTNAELAIFGVTGRNVFVERSVTSATSVRPNAGNVFRAASVLVPHASTIVDVWGHLSRTEHIPTTFFRTFDPNFDAQTRRYGDGLVHRGIYASTNGNHLERAGHFLGLRGEFHWVSQTSFSWNYRFTVRANIW